MSTENKKALVLIADGSEEMEAVISSNASYELDVLRRASIEVTVAGVALKEQTFATCSRGVKIIPDVPFENLWPTVSPDTFDVIIVPGGLGGAKTISSNEHVQKLLANAHQSGKIVAAICAGPISIKSSNINKGGSITCHPVVQKELETEYQFREDRAIVDNNVITSRGPGTAFLFALTIVEQLLGKEKRDEISPPMFLASTL
ncbi:4933_t:CDS:2 [Ambispora gerdemannii]|uniref:D-lactate dehydratase n=1 Tax=Ambispora gerdemannii TaxID=144530 RepID=A0A9N9AN25_9GLOM|nr:4933_t:CDS:2 [Ambispora gerdemannii]